MIRQARSIMLAALVAACGSPAPTTVPSAEDAPIQLRQARGDFGCDTIGVPYRVVTFHIDPGETEQVTAIADTGKVLRTFWSAGFRGGSVDEKVVRDPAGAIVAVDGEVLGIPQDAWPRLHGHFVCPSPDSLYILTPDPA